jgi:hypothetical protein
MPTRRKPSPSSAADPEIDDEDAEETAAEADLDDVDVVIDPEAVVDEDDEDEVDPEAVVVDDVADEDEDEDDEVAEVEIVVPARPASRPSPGRPPSAKEEPEPPFFIGERVVLVKNTRPRTGAPIADHPVGATGRVETVLSQTAIVRFDRASDTKEVVAFTCLESLDDDAKARRAERDQAAADAKAAEAKAADTKA